jgi:hypothetical protein
MFAKFWSEDLKGTGHLEGMSMDGRVILKYMLRKYDEGVWAGLAWFQIRTSVGYL